MHGGSRNEIVNKRTDNLSSPVPWGYESLFQLNREVTSILSKSNLPENERSQVTHPAYCSPSIPPGEVTSRSNSCPLYSNTKLWSSGSPFQVTDQSAELRNHLYQAALYQNSSPFTPLRFPFLPPRGYFPSFPPGIDTSPPRLPFPHHYTTVPFMQNDRMSGTSPLLGKTKRKSPAYVEASSKIYRMQNTTHIRHQTHPIQSRQSPTHTSTSKDHQQSSSPSFILPAKVECPRHFEKGTDIQLASGEMKKVEDLDTTDFVESADICHDVSIEHATVVRLEHIQQTGLFLLSFRVGNHTSEVTISTSPEHPFFVFGHGWSS